MSKEKAPEKPEGDGAPKVNLEAPVYIVMSATETRLVVETFTDDGAAKARASSLAQSSRRLVGVFGPQSAVYAPPPPATAVEVELDFLKKPLD